MRAVVFLTCLLLLHVQGSPVSRFSQCMCLSKPLKHIPLKIIKGPLVKHEPSPFCPQTEYIVTVKDNKQKCVTEDFWKRLQQHIKTWQSRKQTVKPTNFSSTMSASVNITTPKL